MENPVYAAVNAGFDPPPPVQPAELDSNGIKESNSNPVDSPPVEGAPYSAVLDAAGFLPPTYIKYKLRWYILMVFCLATFCQGWLFNMWGPMLDSMRVLFGWNDHQIAILPFYGTSIFTLMCLPSGLILERWGLRRLMIVMVGCMTLCCVIRCIPWNGIASTVFINMSQALNALAGVVIFYVPSSISAIWFPQNERKFATSIGLMSNIAGVAMAFVISPAFVSEPQKHGGPTKSDLSNQYHRYIYVQTACTAALLFIVLIFYPPRPPTPPSESAETPRIQLKAGCRKLFRSRDFWLLCVPVTLLFGTFGGWLTVLDIDLQAKNVNQVAGGKIGTYATFAGVVGGLAVGKLGDHFGNLKAIQIATCALAVQGAIWVMLLMRGLIPFSLPQTYLATILVGGASLSFLPINFELAAEICYPIDEAVVVGLLNVFINGWMSMFLFILFFPAAGTAWLDVFLAIAVVAAFPFTLIIKEKYNRTAVDKHEN